MRIIILVAIASLALSAPAFADEKILLAAAIGAGDSGASSNSGAAIGSGVKPVSKDDDDSGVAGLQAASSPVMSTTKMVTIGAIGAGVIALVAGSSSTSNH